MRKLLLDAVEAAWLLCTTPLRRMIRDAVRDALVHEGAATPALSWKADDRTQGWADPSYLLAEVMHRD